MDSQSQNIVNLSLKSVEMNTQGLNRYVTLQGLFCCPHTKSPLRLVGIEELVDCVADAERERIPGGTIGAFISDAANRAYPLTERVASFLEQDSLKMRTPTPQTAQTGASVTADVSVIEAKRSVKDWYDRYGWAKSKTGQYKDSALFSQNEPVGYGLYEMTSHLAIMDRLAGGEFVLDAASGAIAHSEYLAYSWFYKTRVCVDMSMTALQEADAKLRPNDVCCLADLCALPFRDDTFDGAVSGYTIQHIHQSHQTKAINEIYRVLRPGSHACIFTGVKSSKGRRHKALLSFLKMLQKLLGMLRLAKRCEIISDSANRKGEAPPHQLYFHAQDPSWWTSVAASLTDSYSIECLRLLNKPEFEALYGKSNRAAKVLRLIEGAVPRLAARLSYFCLVVLSKPKKTGNSELGGPRPEGGSRAL
jgi:ubiquinone/menaquinone biosynthesis C-methylase UbiE/uncharacterized protein YbaR (Trm112 family)